MGYEDALFGLAGVLIGAFIGYRFSLAVKAADDIQQAHGLLSVVRIDVERGTFCFEEYRRLSRGAPAWRLPTSTWTAAVTFVSGMRALTPDETRALADFFNVSAELNYCLDRILESATQGPIPFEVAADHMRSHEVEVRRALNKVAQALDPQPPNAEPLTVRALTAVNSALDRLPTGQWFAWRI